MRQTFVLMLVGLLAASTAAEDPIFSGPQAGEPFAPFQAQVVLGENAGERVDVVGADSKSPTLLIFVHRITRPSLGLVRLLVDFGNAKKKSGLETHLVFLSEDVTDTEAWLRRARHALPEGVTPLLSTDGIEGPGSYGLNRKMTLTVLVGDKGKVTANFPLIQPSIQADAAGIGHAMVKALGETKAPTLKEMGWQNRGMQAMDVRYRRMMAPVIQKTASEAQVNKAAKAVEALAAKDRAFRERVHGAASRIVSSGRLSNYGTKTAQEHLKKWSTEFASKEKPEVKSKEESTGASDTSSEKEDSAKAR